MSVPTAPKAFTPIHDHGEDPMGPPEGTGAQGGADKGEGVPGATRQCPGTLPCALPAATERTTTGLSLPATKPNP